MGKGYTVGSVERSLDHHQRDGRILGWRGVPDKPGRYIVELNRSVQEGTIELRSLREAYVFVVGLASAQYALNVARLVELVNQYGTARLGDEWWTGNAGPWIGEDAAKELADLLASVGR